jgi:hypothetical protein
MGIASLALILGIEPGVYHFFMLLLLSFILPVTPSH